MVASSLRKELHSLLISLQKAPVLIEVPAPAPVRISASASEGQPCTPTSTWSRAAGLGFPHPAPPCATESIAVHSDLELGLVCRQPGAWFPISAKDWLDLRRFLNFPFI